MIKLSALLLIALLAAELPGITPARADEPVAGTYSIVAFDPRTGDLGVAVQSKWFGVGGIVPWAKAGVGAIASQAHSNVHYGPRALELMSAGRSVEEIARLLPAGDPKAEFRQFGIVDARGEAAAHTGPKIDGWAGHRLGKHYTVQGNTLAGEQVVAAMAQTFEKARDSGEGNLADWLMAALRAGEDAGGDRRGRMAAGLLVVRKDGGSGAGGATDRLVDLRVDHHTDPTRELARLLAAHKEFFPARHQPVFLPTPATLPPPLPLPPP